MPAILIDGICMGLHTGHLQPGGASLCTPVVCHGRSGGGAGAPVRAGVSALTLRASERGVSEGVPPLLPLEGVPALRKGPRGCNGRGVLDREEVLEAAEPAREALGRGVTV